MKAKELIALLSQNPEAEVQIKHSRYDEFDGYTMSTYGIDDVVNQDGCFDISLYLIYED